MDVESASRFLPIRRVLWDPRDGSPPPIDDGTWDTCVVPTLSFATVEAAYKHLAHGQHPFRSFIIDSVSELQQRFIDGEFQRRQLQVQHWGDVFRQVGGLIKDIRDLTMHPTHPLECVVFTAVTVNDKGKWSPWLQGQLKTLIPYYVDACVYLYVEHEYDEIQGESTEVRRILTRPTDEYVAGERVGGRWPVVITRPNISEMIDMVFGPLDQSNAPTPTPTPTQEPVP